uniref:Carbonic anhydrase n=1 Tax=Oryza rufipogon TaxID=4529 RepID=A0A0E0QJ68_ORYRU
MSSARRLLLFAGAAAAIALLLSATAPVAGAEDDGYSYIPGSPRGPQNWGSLKPEWATCSSGKMQSPIVEIMGTPYPHGMIIRLNANASVVNRGHDIMVRFDGDAGSLKINGTAYQLRQMHWHTPSEHTIDGRRYDMELHMVHLNAQNQAAVIGILYTIGTTPDEFLQKCYIIAISNQEGKEKMVVGGADPNVAKGKDTVYYRYMGSFTTPPCTERVIWTVVRKVPEEDDQFGYIPGTPRGPENWGSLKPEWATCSSGEMQSPINLGLLDLTLAPGLGDLNYTYRNANATVVNRGHDIMVRFDGGDDAAAAGGLVINGTAYRLRQVHWHAPSEHAVDGRRYDMELHMVHLNTQNQTAVVGVLYAIGAQDEFLHKIVNGGVDPNVAKEHDIVYYRYMGSLTTPPCTEGVIWTIVRKVHTVSLSQLALLKAAVVNGNEKNARPLQDVNNRNIGLFIPLPLINV